MGLEHEVFCLWPRLISSLLGREKIFSVAAFLVDVFLINCVNSMYNSINEPEEFKNGCVHCGYLRRWLWLRLQTLGRWVSRWRLSCQMRLKQWVVERMGWCYGDRVVENVNAHSSGKLIKVPFCNCITAELIRQMLKKVASVAKNGMTTRRLLGADTRDHSLLGSLQDVY